MTNTPLAFQPASTGRKGPVFRRARPIVRRGLVELPCPGKTARQIQCAVRATYLCPIEMAICLKLVVRPSSGLIIAAALINE